MQSMLSRRSFLGSSLCLAAGAGLSGLSVPAAAQEVRMRCAWWGSATRAERTQGVIDLYARAHPGVAIVGEPIAGSDYWIKLATGMAGRNVPDIFQLEPSTISDYSGRGACLALDAFVPGTLDVSSFGQAMTDLCRIDGKLYGVALGLNSFSMFFDADVFDAAGVAAPTGQITWEKFAEIARDISEATKDRRSYWGAPYGARYNYLFDVWLRQRGKRLYSPEGSIGYDVEDAKAWFAYWEDLRKKDHCVSADIQTRDDNTIESNALTLGNSAVGFAYSNQLVGYQLLSKGKLGIAMVPGNGSDKTGHYYRPGLIWSIGATTANPEAAAAFISYFVNDIEAGKLLGVERGVPMSPAVREAILPGLNETEKLTVDYVGQLKDKVDEYPAPAPIGANEFDRNVMRPIADAVAFEQTTIAEAAQRLVDEGTTVLSKRI